MPKDTWATARKWPRVRPQRMLRSSIKDSEIEATIKLLVEGGYRHGRLEKALNKKCPKHLWLPILNRIRSAYRLEMQPSAKARLVTR